MKIKLKKLHKDAIIPTYAHFTDACADLYAIEDYFIRPGELIFIRSGLAVEIPEGYYIEMYNRSGNAAKKELVIVSSRIIDADYRGEVFAPIKNIGSKGKSIKKGDRFAQIALKSKIHMVFDLVDELNETERGSGGFGSTGK